jgi:hypothetical protein
VLAHKCLDPISAKPAISEQHCSRFQRRRQGEDKTVVVRFVSGQRETNGKPVGIDDCMNLARQPASRPAHQLFTITGDAGSMLVHSHNGPINHLQGWIMACGRRIHKLIHKPALRQRTKRL